MKITFVLPYADLSGGVRVVATHADRLKRRGHEVLVVSTPRRLPPLSRRLKSLLKGQGWPSARPGPSHLDGLDLVHNVIEADRPVADHDLPDADVVIATWWETAEWVAALSPRKGVKVFFLQHHEIHEGQPIERVRATWRLPFHKIVISGWLGRICAEEYGDSGYSLVPNSVDLELFRTPVRGKRPIPSVGFVYATAPWKGCDLSLEAIRIARRSLPKLGVTAFGSERPLPELPLPPRTAFRLRPPQASIPGLYADTDAWLCASRTEGFGLPVLEAMACRTPPIATPAGAAPELLEDGSGLLVGHEDPEALAGAILKIASMQERDWSALSQAAWATATAYTWDDAAGLFEQALQVTVDRKRSG